MDNKITSLTLISSCSCNLKCKYCLINKNLSIRKESDDLQKNTIEAFKSGQYLKTTLDAIKRFNVESKDITYLDFWGQEPLLTLDYFTEHIEDWLTTYPNIFGMGFSTNMMADPKILERYLIALNKYAKKRIRVEIQFSYDGEWPTNNIRLANANLIKEHIKYIINKFSNEVKIDNLDLYFSIHNVFSFELLDYLSEPSIIDEYDDEFQEMLNSCRSIINNRKIKENLISLGYGCGLEVPQKTSNVDGKRLARFVKDFIERHPDKNPTNSTILSLLDFVNSSITSNYLLKQAIFNPVEKIFDAIYNKNYQKELSSFNYCCSFVGGLKLMYDGTILTCQDYLHDTTEESLAFTNDKFEKSVKETLLRNHIHFNIYKDSDEDLTNVVNLHKIGKTSQLFYGIHQMLTLMQLLARIDQIDPTYLKDREKCIRHALFLATKGTCQVNMRTMTGSHYMKSAAFIRIYCNGLIDLAEKFLIQD